MYPNIVFVHSVTAFIAKTSQQHFNLYVSNFCGPPCIIFYGLHCILCVKLQYSNCSSLKAYKIRGFTCILFQGEDIEKSYLDKANIDHKFQTKEFKYALKFAEMEQQNLGPKYFTKRKVRRRPLFKDIKDIM